MVLLADCSLLSPLTLTLMYIYDLKHSLTVLIIFFSSSSLGKSMDRFLSTECGPIV